MSKRKKKERKQQQKRLDEFTERVHFWQSYLCLDDYDIYVEQGTLADGTMADISRDTDARSAVVRLHDAIPGVDVPLDSLAKHELIHLLLSELSALAHTREVTHDQIAREEERAVVKLCRLIE